MVKFLLILFLLLQSNWSFAQIYLSYTLREVEDNLENSRITNLEEYQDGTLCTTVMFTHQESQFVRRYYFEARTRKCFLYVLEPVERQYLNDFVSYANKEYVVMGPRRWRTYMNELTIEVELKYNREVQRNFFFFSILKEH
jgi:hypothetical protein